jgi:hypothetical protein
MSEYRISLNKYFLKVYTAILSKSTLFNNAKMKNEHTKVINQIMLPSKN